MLIGFVLVAWTLGSFWYFFKNIGNKYGKDPWYAGILLFPVMIIAILTSFFPSPKKQ